MSFISIAGMIGVGKSTLAKNLGDYYDSKEVYYESVDDNPYLEDFYNNESQKKVTLPMEFYLLNQRLLQHQRCLTNRYHGLIAIEDRTIYEDKIFVNVLNELGVLDDRETDTYRELANTIYSMIQPPDVIIYLDANAETCLERIKMRERQCEVSITLEYLEKLHKEYAIIMDDLSKYMNVITIDYTEFIPIQDIIKKIGKK